MTGVHEPGSQTNHVVLNRGDGKFIFGRRSGLNTGSGRESVQVRHGRSKVSDPQTQLCKALRGYAVPLRVASVPLSLSAPHSPEYPTPSLVCTKSKFRNGVVDRSDPTTNSSRLGVNPPPVGGLFRSASDDLLQAAAQTQRFSMLNAGWITNTNCRWFSAFAKLKLCQHQK